MKEQEQKQLLSIGPVHYGTLLVTGVGKKLTFLKGKFTIGVNEQCLNGMENFFFFLLLHRMKTVIRKKNNTFFKVVKANFLQLTKSIFASVKKCADAVVF